MLIRPIQVTSEDDSLEATLGDLVKAFRQDLKDGKVQFKSVNEFTRLATLLYQIKGDIDLDEPSVTVPDLDPDQEDMMEALYASLMESTNRAHDEENKVDKWH